MKEFKSKEDAGQQTIETFSMKNIERQKYDFSLTKFIIQNNLSFSIVEPLVILLKTLKDEDLLRQCDFSKIDCTRARVIGNQCIALAIKEKMENLMDKSYYHLIIDEVSDRFGTGYLGISVRYLDEQYCPRSKLYRLIPLEDNSTGEKLYEILTETVLHSQRRKNNLISMVTDGAGAMAGRLKGLHTRVAQSIDHLFWLQCVCHCLDLVMDTACQNTVRDTLSVTVTDYIFRHLISIFDTKNFQILYVKFRHYFNFRHSKC